MKVYFKLARSARRHSGWCVAHRVPHHRVAGVAWTKADGQAALHPSVGRPARGPAWACVQPNNVSKFADGQTCPYLRFDLVCCVRAGIVNCFQDKKPGNIPVFPRSWHEDSSLWYALSWAILEAPHSVSDITMAMRTKERKEKAHVGYPASKLSASTLSPPPIKERRRGLLDPNEQVSEASNDQSDSSTAAICHR